MTNATLHAILERIATENLITAPCITIDASPNHGYLAAVNKISISDAADACRPLHLFIKRKPDNVSAEWSHFYQNEAKFYTTIMSAFAEVAATAAQPPPLVPKVYHVDNEIIIMEDLIENGYMLWTPLNTPLDRQHVTAVLEAYARFHAFSFALKTQQPEKFAAAGAKFEWFLTNHERLLACGYYKSLLEKLAVCFDQEKEFEYVDATANFLCHGQVAYLEALLQSDNDVIIHGDNWTHNFMFGYHNDKTEGSQQVVESVCLLDFQIFRKSLPVIDLTYFFATSACSQEVFDHIEEYLKVYHTKLVATLKELNCDENTYTWQTLLSEWRKYSPKGIILGAILNKMMIADKDELENVKNIELPMKFDFVSRNEELFTQRMRTIIKYFYDSGILQQWI